MAVNVDAGKQVAAALSERYGEEAVRYDRYGKQTAPFDFPVLRRDGKVVSSTGMSTVLATVPVARFDYVFLDRQYFDDADPWLRDNQLGIIEAPEVEEEDQPDEGLPETEATG